MPYNMINDSNGGFRITDNLDSAGAGIAPATGLNAVKEEQFGPLHRTTFNLTAFPIAVTDALAYAGVQLFDFPAGRLYVVGATASLRFKRVSAASTINDSASMTWAVGTATASNITLSSTMVDLIPKTTKALSEAVGAYNTASTAVLASPAVFDGTSTAKDIFLNVGFETNTEIDADAVLNATGNITITWIDLGDI